LPEAAQRRAWDNSPDFSWECDDEFAETLAAFEKIFDIDVYNFNVDPFWNPSWSYVKAGPANECPAGDPLRVARFIWNNYADDLKKGKYYSTRGRWIDGKYHYKYRYSRATFEMDNCPLTGICYDYDILQPVLDCLRYKRFFDSIDDLFDECLHDFFHAWSAEKEHLNSFENFAELAACNDWEFLETGEMYK
jgi:hypothetical protein